MNEALEYIKSKHNGEIPYQYGSRECAKLMNDFAEEYYRNKIKGKTFSQDEIEKSYDKGFKDAMIKYRE